MLLFVLLLVLACPSIDAIGNFKLLYDTETNKQDGDVVEVHVFYRNGLKQPKEFYPNDPDANNAIWNFGRDELTIKGRKQGYELGRTLRMKYYKMFPIERSWKIVRSTSSNTERNIMSSSMVLAGMLPPSYNDLWSDVIQWQPAVTYVDELLTCKECIRTNYEYKIGDRNKQMYYRIILKTGMKVSNPGMMLKLYECLEIENQHGVFMPTWTDDLLASMRTEAAKAFDYSDDSVKNKVGRILEKIAKFDGTNVTHKINLYSTHGSIIAGLLKALNIRIKEPPNFMSAVIIDFRVTQDGRQHAQFWYRMVPKDPFVRIGFENCGVRCPVEELRKILMPYFPKVVQEETIDCKQRSMDIFHCLMTFGVVLTCLIVYSLLRTCHIGVKNQFLDQIMLWPLWANMLNFFTSNLIYYNIIKFLKECVRYLSGNKPSGMRESRIF